ncbi:MAG: EAL domain-containing protein [Amphritea sp.]
MTVRTILLALTLVCCFTAVASAFSYYSYTSSSTEREARFNAEKIVEMVDAELEAYLKGQMRQLAVQAVMPDIQRFLAGGTRTITSLLNDVCQRNGASICYLLDTEGVFIASNDFPKKSAALGRNYAYRPYFKQAVSGVSAIYLAKGDRTKKRGIYFSHRVSGPDGQLLGVVVNKISVRGLEQRFDKLPGQMALMGPDGVVFAANTPEWVFNSLLPIDAVQRKLIINSKQYGEEVPKPLPFRWFGESSIEDEFNNQYWVYSQDVKLLPGWKLVYLNSVQQLSVGAFADTTLLTVMFLLSGGVVVMVSLLYRHGSDNINKRHQVEARLRKSEARLLQLSQIATEAVIMHRDNNIIDFNEVAEQLFGYSREELLLTPLSGLWTPARQEDAIQAMGTEKEQNFESEAIRRDGQSFPVEVNTKTSVIDGENVSMMCLRDITQRKQQEKRMHYQAQFDALTRLPNRKLMRDRLERAISRSQVKGTMVVLMFIDLDDFKKINDSLGHEVGDKLLIAVSKRLRDAVREDDILARYGGDEFILILEDQEDLYDAEIVARKILTVLAMEFRLQKRSFFISGSIGIAVSPSDGIVAEELLKRADMAMYRVKDEGRNSYCFYSPEMNTDITSRLEIEHQLRGALSRQELLLHYQPIYCLKSQRLLGVEVLLRWENEALGSIRPDQFIPVAEQIGLIVPIGEWVMSQACMQAKSWLKHADSGFKLGINVSPRQFKDDHLVPMLQRVLDDTGFPPEQLVLELTEGLLIKHDESTGQTLKQVKAMGIGLSMDDFGTGYSSLSYLKQFPFDTLKIDRSFVRDLGTDPGDQQLIVASIAMAKGLGLKVIAEGVEDSEQLSFLQSAGCDAVQGFYLGRPVDAEHFSEKVLPMLEIEQLMKTVLAHPELADSTDC